MENGTHEQIVLHLEKEIKLNGLETLDELHMNSVSQNGANTSADRHKLTKHRWVKKTGKCKNQCRQLERQKNPGEGTQIIPANKNSGTKTSRRIKTKKLISFAHANWCASDVPKHPQPNPKESRWNSEGFQRKIRSTLINGFGKRQFLAAGLQSGEPQVDSSFIREYSNPVIAVDFCAQYVDDFEIAANNATDLTRTIGAVFECCRLARWKLPKRRHHFKVRQVEFSGRPAH